MNKKSIEQEAEELYPYAGGNERLRLAKIQGYIAAATKYSEQQRQVIADTWDAAVLREKEEWCHSIDSINSISAPTKERYLNNLFPSEIKGEQQTK